MNLFLAQTHARGIQQRAVNESCIFYVKTEVSRGVTTAPLHDASLTCHQWRHSGCISAIPSSLHALLSQMYE